MANDANIIKIKRSGTSGAPSSLKLGELAYSYLAADGNPTNNGGDRLFIGANGVNVSTGNANDIIVIGGKYFTDLLDHTRGTLTASSAIITDGNSVVDRILTTGLNIGGINGAGLDYTISTDNNNNLVLSTGTGKLSINGAYTLPNADGTAGYVLATNGSGVVSWTAISSTTLTNGSYTATLNTNGTFEANAFLAAQGLPNEYGNAGFSFSGTEGGYDTGMFSDGDGKLEFYSNNNVLAYAHTDGSASWRFEVPVTFGAGASGGYTLPTADGTAGYVLTTDGNGAVTWAAAAATLSLGASSVTGDSQSAVTLNLTQDTLKIVGDGSSINVSETQSGATGAHTYTYAITIPAGGVSNTQLANSTITVNGTTLTLGDSSDTITAATPNALTNGANIQSFTFDGSASGIQVALDTDLTGINSVSGPSSTGQVVINASPDGGTTTHAWAFTEDALFRLPSLSTIGEGSSPSGVGTSVIITPYNGTDANQLLKIYPGTVSEGNHLHLTTGDLTVTSLFLGNDAQYVRTRTDGAMVIGTGDTNPETSGLGHRWIFGTDATLALPATGSGAAVISAGTNALSLTANSNTWEFGADGTTYFPHYTFPSANGATGQVLTANGSTGVLSWTTLSQTFYIGSTEITTGNASGDVVHIQGLTEIDVGSLVLKESTVSTTGDTGSVTLIANTGNGDFTWTFDGSGVLTLPATTSNGIGGEIVFPSTTSGTQATINYNADIQGGAFELKNTDGAGNTLYAGLNLDGYVINFANTRSGTTHNWNLNADGSTSLPNYTLPAGAGSSGQVLTYPGSGSTLTWTTLSQTLYIGTTSITTGNSSGSTTVIQGLTEVDIGDLVLSGNTIENGNNTTGNVQLIANSGSGDITFTFNASGQLVLPNGTTFGGNSGTTLQIADGQSFVLNTTSGGAINILENGVTGIETLGDTMRLYANNAYITLNNDSSLSFSGYTLPAAGGSPGQVLMYPNSGSTLSWQTVYSSFYIGTTEITTGNNSGDVPTITGLTEIDVGNLAISTNQIANTTGGTGTVTIESNDGTNNYTWTFEEDGSLNVAGKITNLSEPTAPQDAATKHYVDAAAQGLKIHQPVVVATISDLSSIGGTVSYADGGGSPASVGATLTFTTPITVLDNYTFTGNERILVKDQVNAKQNGVYVYTSSTVWTRADDFDHPDVITGADFMFVEDGTLNGSTGWVQTDQAISSIGAGGSNITFVQFSAANSYLAGDGINITGNSIAVKLATHSALTLSGGSLSVDSGIAGDGLGYSTGVLNVQYDGSSIDLNGSNQLEIKSTWAGSTGITTVGTITTGTWHGTAISEIYGGTNQTTYAKGDILYASDTNTLSKLTAGTNGQTLQLQGGVPVWADLDGGTY